MAVDRLTQGILVGCAWLAITLCGAAQDLPSNLRLAPATGVLDDEGFLAAHPVQAATISEAIQKLRQDHGFKVFLIIEPVLIGATVPQRADELRRQWAPNGEGLVVVYESSSRQLAIGWDITGGPLPQDESSRRIPSFTTSAMLNRALGNPDPQLLPEDYLQALVKNLAAEFGNYYDDRRVSTPPERTLKTTLVVVGTLALLGLATMIAAAIVRFTSVSAVQAFSFPNVECLERLAAPCGASVTSRRFATPKSRAS